MEANENPTTWDKIKTHFKKHKTAYIWGGIAVVATGVGYAVGKNQGDDYDFMSSIEGDDNMQITTGPESTVNVDNSTHNTSVNMGGHMHKIVKNTSTGEVFESVNDAAVSAGVSRTAMSNHVNGRSDHIFGDVYEIIGVGTTG